MAQHAELVPAREHDRAQARGQAEQPHQHRHRLHGIGDREAAVEDAQRQAADVAPLRQLELRPARQRPHRLHRPGDAGPGREPQRRVAHAAIPGERDVVGAVDE